ncbi:MAG: hypothetical protein HYY24_26875 [Verrucomicrobia bacterium]|nr:hypothetical protein [Verrucomicrobiota bacterium]
MQTLSESFLSSLSTWLQWIAIIGTGLGLLAAIGTFFVSTELSGRLERRLATAHSEAEKAKAIAEEIRMKQQPRRISGDERQKLVAGLVAASGARDVAIVYNSGDKEAEMFAKEISSAFTEAGIAHLTTWWTGDPLRTGVSVLSRSDTSDSTAAVISRAIIEAGFPVRNARGALIPEKTISVVVGPKP